MFAAIEEDLRACMAVPSEQIGPFKAESLTMAQPHRSAPRPTDHPSRQFRPNATTMKRGRAGATTYHPRATELSEIAGGGASRPAYLVSALAGALAVA
jgi:hypothetical protein